MPAQQRRLSKNYIGLLSDKSEQPRQAMPPAKSDRSMKKYIRALVAAVLNRGADAR